MDEFTSRARELLTDNPTFLFFLVLALGYLLGNVGPKGKKLGAVAGVLFAGLLFGHFGFSAPPAAKTFGFAIFIFAVGYQAGPGFFEVIRTDGLRYLALALVVAVTGSVLAVGFARLFGFEPGISAGLLGGGLTTTPTLAAAQEALRAGNVVPPEGFPVEKAIDNVGAAYAITYLFGVVGLLLVMKVLPRLFRVDLAGAVATLRPAKKAGAVRAADMSLRAYRVDEGGYTVRELEDAVGYRARITKVRRGGSPLDFELSTALRAGDEVLVLGEPGALLELTAEGATEIPGIDVFDTELETVQVVVQKPGLAGKSLNELSGERRPGGMLLLGIRRLQVDLEVEDDLVVHKGDVLTVLGDPSEIAALAEKVGHVEREIEETDLFTFALGIAVGILLGTLSVTIGGVSIGLGSAGGLLASGLLIGFLRSVSPTFGRVPGAALWLFMELGLLMFMTGVGLGAGGQVVETLLSSGPTLILCGIVVTVVPVFVAYAFGTRVLKLNPALLLGGVAGAMTSGAALKVVQEVAKSPTPALGYTGAYAFANVFLTLAGSLVPYLDRI